MASLVEKYVPTRINEILNHQLGVLKIKEFLLNYKKFKKALIVYGPTGVGKTASVRAIANDLGFDIVELTAEQISNKDSIKLIINNAAQTASLFGNKKMILIDSLESFVIDKGSISTLIEIIELSKFPVVITAIDIWEPKLKYLRNMCELVQFSKLPTATISSYLNAILKKENVACDKNIIDAIAKNANGDLRAALNDLNLLLTGQISQDDLQIFEKRNTEESIFNAIQKVFKSENVSEVIGAFDDVGIDLDEACLWISENIVNEYTSPEEIAKAYNMISKSDVWLGRVKRRQYYDLLYYANVLATAGVSLSKTKKNNKFVKYSKPTKLIKLFETKEDREIIKSIAQKIASICHTSTKIAEETYIPMLYFIFKTKNEKAEKISTLLNLNKEEIELLSSKRFG